MAQSVAGYIAEALETDAMPDTTEAMYIELLVFDNKQFVDEVSGHIRSDTLLCERLEYKMRLWVPHMLEKLRNKSSMSVESWIAMILEARKRFPESIEPLCTLSELAEIRRTAHIRAGKEAVEYLHSGRPQLSDVYRHVLASALMARVPRDKLGKPSREICRIALLRALPKVRASDPWAADVLAHKKALCERSRMLNLELNPLLVRAA